MCVTVMYLQTVLSKIVNAHHKKAVTPCIDYRCPHSVSFTLCISRILTCVTNKVVKQERVKALHCGLALKFWLFLIFMFFSISKNCL